jgi:hypothetical protein
MAHQRRWLCQVKLARLRRLTAQKSQDLLPQFFVRTKAVAPAPTRIPDHPPTPSPPPHACRHLSYPFSNFVFPNNTLALRDTSGIAGKYFCLLLQTH